MVYNTGGGKNTTLPIGQNVISVRWTWPGSPFNFNNAFGDTVAQHRFLGLTITEKCVYNEVAKECNHAPTTNVNCFNDNGSVGQWFGTSNGTWTNPISYGLPLSYVAGGTIWSPGVTGGTGQGGQIVSACNIAGAYNYMGSIGITVGGTAQAGITFQGPSWQTSQTKLINSLCSKVAGPNAGR